MVRGQQRQPRAAAAAPATGPLHAAAGCRAVVEAAVAGLGGLDVLVNNAGSGGGGPVGDLEEDLLRVLPTGAPGKKGRVGRNAVPLVW